MPTFQHNHISLNYQIFGQGTVPIIAFHGFSRTSDDYALYREYLGTKYKVFAVDLFYHGKSKIDGRKTRVFSKKELKTIFERFLLHLGLTRFQILGYSMGGRLTLFFLEQFPERLTKIYLLAPDGLKINFWNWLVTNTETGKQLYGFTIHHPAWVSLATKTGQTLKILPDKMDKFLNLNFATKGARLRVYRVWKLYKNIYFDIDLLASLIKDHRIETAVVVGTKDPVVSPKICREFCDLIPEQGTFHLISAGHDLFKPHALAYITEKVL